MSSNYLSFANMNMIERLLAEVREPGSIHDVARENAAVHFLIREVEQSQAAEEDLRPKLAAHLDEWETTGAAIVRWDDEGRARGVSLRAEAQRRSDNDTDGTRRRMTETKDRNQLI